MSCSRIIRILSKRPFALFCLAVVAAASVAGRPEEPVRAGRNGFRGNLPPVPEEGFYAIDLPPEAAGACRPDRGDIRLWGPDGREVPYLLRDDQDTAWVRRFVSYPMQVTVGRTQTEVEVETGGVPLASLVFRIKNAETEKTADLRGSNDRVRWYAVKERVDLPRFDDPGRSEADWKIGFPLSDYRYYRLTVSDSLSAPLNFLQAGRLDETFSVRQNRWELAPDVSRTTDREHRTEIELAYPVAYPFSRMELVVSAPKYYRREIRFCRSGFPEETPDEKPGNAGAAAGGCEPGEYLATIASADGPVSGFPVDLYTDTLRFCIVNADDRPLRIDSVRAYADRFYLVAYLYPEQSYSVGYGEKDRRAPSYDLAFASYVPARLPHLELREVRALRPGERPQDPAAWKRFMKTYGIWIVIGVVILQLLYFVRKLLK